MLAAPAHGDHPTGRGHVDAVERGSSRPSLHRSADDAVVAELMIQRSVGAVARQQRGEAGRVAQPFLRVARDDDLPVSCCCHSFGLRFETEAFRGDQQRRREPALAEARVGSAVRAQPDRPEVAVAAEPFQRSNRVTAWGSGQVVDPGQGLARVGRQLRLGDAARAEGRVELIGTVDVRGREDRDRYGGQ